MRLVNLAAIDLNLLVALQALLQERSVTRAARTVGLSQPAMSRALGRLRDLFEDPILVRSGHEMVPTPRALAVIGPLEDSLEAVRKTLQPPESFDPRTSSRSFALGAIDTTQVAVLPRLLGHIEREAPGVEVMTRPLAPAAETFQQLAMGERDLAIGRFPDTPGGIKSELLYRDRMVCLVRDGHPRVRRKLTLKRYVAEAHLAALTVAPSETPFTIEDLLASQGLKRRVVCTVENLAVAPLVVSRTDLICTATEETISPFASGLGVRILDPPFAVPSLDLHVAWHERNQHDGGHIWLREALLGLFR